MECKIYMVKGLIGACEFKINAVLPRETRAVGRFSNSSGDFINRRELVLEF